MKWSMTFTDEHKPILSSPTIRFVKTISKNSPLKWRLFIKTYFNVFAFKKTSPEVRQNLKSLNEMNYFSDVICLFIDDQNRQNRCLCHSIRCITAERNTNAKDSFIAEDSEQMRDIALSMLSFSVFVPVISCFRFCCSAIRSRIPIVSAFQFKPSDVWLRF